MNEQEAPTPEEMNAFAEKLAEDIRRRAAEAAETAVKKKVQVSLSPTGRVRRNSTCPCGSGAKFKKCCLPEVKAGEKNLPSRAALRAYMRNQKS